MKRARAIILVLLVAGLAFGTWRNRDFWSTPDQRGDALFHAQKYSEAAKTYRDPWHIGVAQYRNGDFEKAATTFARVSGAVGAFDQGNAWLMHGNYDAAVASYDRALGFRAGWKEAEENKALAIARKKVMDDSGKDRDKEQGDTQDPDGITFDQKGEDQKGEPVELSTGELSDEQLRATWLRRVQTTPGEFLKAKFAYQSSHLGATAPENPSEGGSR